MRGRKPKPTQVKVLTGNPGHHPLNSNEPTPYPSIPDCPPQLNPVAQAEWYRISIVLGQLRLLTELDRAALAVYCAAFALWAEAQEMISKHGTMVRSPKGFPMQSPYIGLANRQAEIMLRIASEFGFTPASRARMVSPQANPMLPLFESDGQE